MLRQTGPGLAAPLPGTGADGVRAMGHVDAVKAVLLAATLLSWAALARAMLGGDRPGGLGHAGCAIAFLVTAAITRLTFTEVETRVQIAGFGVAAAVLVARGVTGADLNAKLSRWARCVLGAAVGAVTTRELVHHYLERWL